jgi:hypothetical protein
VLHCDFCGATLSNEDRSCRTCGAAVSKAQPAIALASPRVASAPLRQWGKGEEGSSEASDALYRWDVTTPPSAALASVAEPPGQSARGYSRLKLYLLAFVVAALIVGAYMALAGRAATTTARATTSLHRKCPQQSQRRTLNQPLSRHRARLVQRRKHRRQVPQPQRRLLLATTSQ